MKELNTLNILRCNVPPIVFLVTRYTIELIIVSINSLQKSLRAYPMDNPMAAMINVPLLSFKKDFIELTLLDTGLVDKLDVVGVGCGDCKVV
jgi:hypothetical protein